MINIEIYMYKNFNSKHYLTTLLALIFSVCFSAQSNESSVVLEGHYQGKNLYVQNPFAGSGVGFVLLQYISMMMLQLIRSIQVHLK